MITNVEELYEIDEADIGGPTAATAAAPSKIKSGVVINRKKEEVLQAKKVGRDL